MPDVASAESSALERTGSDDKKHYSAADEKNLLRIEAAPDADRGGASGSAVGRRAGNGSHRPVGTGDALSDGGSDLLADGDNELPPPGDGGDGVSLAEPSGSYVVQRASSGDTRFLLE